MDAQNLPPRWPPNPASLVVDNPTYEFSTVPLTSVTMVTSHTVKVDDAHKFSSTITDGQDQVDVDYIVFAHRISHMQDAIQSLTAVLEQWLSSKTIPEVDWSHIRSLDFQEILRSRNELAKRLADYACTLCEAFDSHVSDGHSEFSNESSLNCFIVCHHSQKEGIASEYRRAQKDDFRPEPGIDSRLRAENSCSKGT